jgi:hypothetical protein
LTILGGAVAALVMLALVLTVFMRSDAANIANLLRSGGPAALVLAALASLAFGAAVPGGILFAAGAGWWAARGNAARPVVKRPRSSIRTAALEVEVDHRTGALEGIVLAGTFEGKMLDKLQWPQLRRLYGELAGDAESRQLLEAYLDRRLPAWRKNTQPYVDRGHRVTPSAGSMTKEEAYQVLGLEAGAGPADVRKAHRRLLQRLHPDVGRTSVLALRIDKAKDVLLSDHS